MAENSRMSKLSEKDDECIFSWKLFTAWDYMIGNAETAHNRVASIVVGFKEALLEEAEKMRQSRDWKVIAFRILVNTIVLGLLSFSAFIVVLVVKRSTESDSTSTAWRRNEITVVLSLISLFFPMLFEVLGLLEQYHPRKQLRIQLARIMVLNLLNLYSLIFALFDKISYMTLELEIFRNQSEQMATTSDLIPKPTKIYQNSVLDCTDECENDDSGLLAANMIMALTANVSTSMLPLIRKVLSSTATSFGNFSEITTIKYEEMYRNFTNLTLESNFTEDDVYSDDQKNFIDYLQFILFNTKLDLFNNSSDNATNDGNFTSTTTSLEDYFKSSLSPNLSVTSTTTDYYNFTSSSYLEEISSTLVSLTTNKNCTRICRNVTIIEEPPTTTLSPELNLNYSTKFRLRSLCWETMFGQELIKLTVMDLVLTLLSTLAMDFARGLFVRVMNRCWCWNLEKQFPQYGDFKVAENILHLVNNQGMVWMGMFFSPGLVVINVVKLYVMMYLRSWAVLTCNVPHEIIFRASRSNNFYYALLLMMLFLCVLPVGYAIVWIRPSWHCGPFSKYHRIFHIFTKTIKENVPEPIERALDYIASPGIVIPLLVLLILIIYYLVSLTGALREANVDLKVQLRRERTEERRKMFQLADKRRRRSSGGSGDYSNTPFAKWKKILGATHSGKSFDDTPNRQESGEFNPQPLNKLEKGENKGMEFFSKLIKKALRKTSLSEDDGNQNVDDGTDTEQHESLPEDVVSTSKEIIKPQVHRPGRSSISSGSFDFQRAVGGALAQKRLSNNSPKISEIDNEPSSARPILPPKKKHHHQLRQDSSSSIWSDKIPVIKISKTESSEFLDRENEENERKVDEPKSRHVLRKQSTEFDDDLPMESKEFLDLEKDDFCAKSESSDDNTATTREGSIDTILKSPEKDENEENTESSSGYADVPSI